MDFLWEFSLPEKCTGNLKRYKMKKVIKNTSTEAHHSKKTVLVILGVIFFSMFFIGTVSAVMEWDNVLDYENNDLTVIITNWLGLGERIGSATLKSHSSVGEVLQFGYGEEEVVMYYNLNFSRVYVEGLGEVSFTDMRTGKKVQKDYYFVEWAIKDVVVDDYDFVNVGKNINGSINWQWEIVGNHLEEKGSWERRINNDIPNKNVRLGLKTYVDKDDYIDAKWVIAGKEVSRHAVWNASLEANMISWWPMNLSSGDVFDSLGNATGTNNGTTRGVAGKINNSFSFTASEDDNVVVGDDATFDFEGDVEFSISAWVFPDSLPANSFIFAHDINGIRQYGAGIQSGKATVEINGGAPQVTGNTTINTTAWHHIVWVFKSDDVLIYVNGSFDNRAGSRTSINAGTPDFKAIIGARQHTVNNPFDGKIDEVVVWNRTISASEVTNLYNENRGCTFQLCDAPPDDNPVITATAPPNAYNTTDQTIVFNVTASDDINLLNITIYIDDVLNQTNTSVINNTLTEFSILIPEGDHTWFTRVWDNNSQSSTSNLFNLTVDSSPTINVFSPTNTTHTTSTIFFNATNSSVSVDKWIVNYNGTNVTLSAINTTLTVEDGSNFNLLLYANNSVTGVFGLNDTIFFSVDTTSPQITVTFPNETLDFQEININLSVNWTVSDARLDTCTLEYDGINTTVTCLENQTNINITSITNKSLVFYVNDTLGNSNSSSVSWNYKIFQNSLNYTLSTTGGNSEIFTLNITKISSLQISTVDLVYNSSASSSSFTSGDTLIVTNTLIVPNPSADSNLSFFFSFTMDDDSIINTTSNNQTVLNFNIGNCSSNSVLVYNFTLFDEENQTQLINVTIDYAFNLFDSSRTVSIVNSSFNSTANPTAICINQNLTSTSLYSLDGILQYVSSDATGYLTRFYNILNFSLKSSTIPNNISIYDVISNTATPFQLTFRDSSLVPAPNILVNVNKRFVSSNDFKTVEIPITDTNGQTILNLVINTGIYNLIFIDIGGNIIASFTKVTAFCDVAIEECTLSLSAPSTIEKTFNLSASTGISYVLSYTNSTSTVTLTFSSLNSTALTARIIGTTQNQFGNRSVCDSSLTSTLGTVDCDTSSILTTDNYLFIDIFSNGNYVATRVININPQIPLIGGLYGTNGFFIAFLLLLIIIILFSNDKQVLLVMLGIGWAVILILGLVKGTIIGSVSAGIWLLVSIITMIWKLRQEDIGR